MGFPDEKIDDPDNRIFQLSVRKAQTLIQMNYIYGHKSGQFTPLLSYRV